MSSLANIYPARFIVVDLILATYLQVPIYLVYTILRKHFTQAVHPNLKISKSATRRPFVGLFFHQT